MFRQIINKPPGRQWTQAHPILANLLLASLYYAFCQLGFTMAAPHDHVSPIWPSTGLALAAVLIGGRKLLPGILIGAFVANFCTGLGALPSVFIALGNTSEAFIALLILQLVRKYGSELAEYSLLTWITIAAILAPISAVILGTMSIHLFSTEEIDSSIIRIGLTWWAGDAVGALIVTPALLTLHRFKLSALWLFKVICFIILAAATGELIFGSGPGSPLLFLAFPVILLACYLFGQSGAAWSTLGFLIHASSVTYAGADVISNHLQHQILLFDLFLGVLAITSLIISSFYQKKHFLALSLVLIAGWTISGALYYTLSSTSADIDEIRFKSMIRDTETIIINRLHSYIDQLRSCAIFYSNSDSVTQKEWLSYVSHLVIDKQHTGIHSMGFIQPSSTDGLPDFLNQVRDELNVPEFKIKGDTPTTQPAPDAMGHAHYILTHMAPLKLNKLLVGIDTATDQNRRELAQVTRDTGKPMMSLPITLYEDNQNQSSFLIYLAAYKSDMPLDTVDQRRKACLGWVTTALYTERFFSDVLSSRHRELEFKVYAGNSPSPNNLLHASNHAPPENRFQADALTSQLNLAGRTLTIKWSKGPDHGKQHTHYSIITAVCLALISCLLAGTFVSLQSTSRKANKIAAIQTKELRKLNDKLKAQATEREKAEYAAEQARLLAEAASEAKSNFLATMSHEIRTPMNSVIGFTDLLSQSPLNNDQRNWVHYIQTSGSGLLSIINDILDFSKIESGKLDLEAIIFDLSEVAQEVSDSYATFATESGIEIHTQIDKQLPSQLIGDPVRIKQILTNLVGNSLKFTNEGSITTSIKWSGDAYKGTALIQVSDTGVGIPPEHQKHLFEQFTQADNSTTRKYGGTGLGLAICKKLTELMHGSIEIESSEGKGTTMTIQIPLKVPTDEELKKTDTAKNNSTNPKIDYKLDILLVDDNAANQRLGQIMLERMGCKVTLAGNGQEAIELVKTKHFPIIFMDCQMPVLNGYDCTHKIRQLESTNSLARADERQRIIIIALTADASKTAQKNCRIAGMDNFIQKPYKVTDFKKALDHYGH